MSIETWVIVGLLAGFLASKFVIRSGEGLLRDLGLGIGGAVLAGWIFGALTAPEATGLDVFGLIVTLAGASAVLVVYHTFFPHVRQG
jgi:uncharacterized membrane protein YeaQ/YmgE (transglycosylase-associated protein family)